MVLGPFIFRGINTKVFGISVNSKANADIFYQIMIILLVILLEVKLKEKEHIFIVMVQYMKVNGKMINLMEMVRNYLEMVLILKDFMKMVSKKKELLNGMMEVIMMEK